MKIGILSDTHVSNSGRRVLPPRLWDDFKGVEMILHAGDLTSARVLSELESIAPVLAVVGNNDAPSLGLPDSRRLEIEGLVIGIAHGDRFASPSSASAILASTSEASASTSRARVPASLPFPGNGQTSAFALSHVPDADVMIFGHSHRPLISRATIPPEMFGHKRRVLLVNPGSPTDKRWSPHWGVALLTIEAGAAHAEAILW